MGELQRLVANHAEQAAAADQCRRVPQPISRHFGEAQVSYLRGHPFAEVAFAVRGQPVVYSEDDARMLITALMSALTARGGF